jgi:catechol 2,3-dioxygenase-like lactoylglutathione lyase family enzyme
MTATFGAVTPLVPVRDVDAAIAFYRDRLGFAEEWHHGDADGLRRDAAEIVLTRCPGPAAIFEWTSFRIAVTGIAVLHDACRAAEIVHPNGALQDRPWGTSEFAVLDPDGICITFWERR